MLGLDDRPSDSRLRGRDPAPPVHDLDKDLEALRRMDRMLVATLCGLVLSSSVAFVALLAAMWTV